MLRRGFAIVALLALALTVVTPALADSKRPDGKKPEKAASGKINGKAFQGTLVGISGDTWTVDTKKADNVTVRVVDGTTRLKVPFDKRATAASFKVGDRVAVKLQNRPTGDQPWDARAVHLIPGKSVFHFTGRVTGTTATTVTVERANEPPRVFTVPEGTPIRTGQATKTLGDLTTGVSVTVVARPAVGEGDATAAAIKVHVPDDDDRDDFDDDDDGGSQGAQQKG